MTRKTWRQAGCYVHRARKPHAPIGLPIIGRHTAYVGQTNSRHHRDRQHIIGGGTYRATAKAYSDLDVKIYPLPCLFPNWRRGRLIQEQLWIWLLWPVYNVDGNRWNPRRITPAAALRQRAARNSSHGWNMGRALLRWLFWCVVIGAVIVALSGCGPMSDGGAGTVVERKAWRCSESAEKTDCRRHSITTARDGSGTRDTGFVSEKVYNACRIGERWPTCKNGG